MNAGLILAGGIGSRMTGSVPKQFVEVGGRTVVSYVLSAFEQCEEIAVNCVVVHDMWRGVIEEACRRGCIFAEPGATRQHSIHNGLLALKGQTIKWVIVHDAARPLISPAILKDLLEAAQGYDGATPALPVNETIYYSFNGKTIASTLERDQIFVGQTPECYDFRQYCAAHEQFYEMLGEFRGSSTIAVNAGMKIARAKGDAGNFKLTNDADLERFREIIERSAP